MFEVVPIRSENADAIDLLNGMIKRVKDGEISAVSISWVASDKTIGGEFSRGDDQIMMWAALEHCARAFYTQYVSGDDDV